MTFWHNLVIEQHVHRNEYTIGQTTHCTKKKTLSGSCSNVISKYGIPTLSRCEKQGKTPQKDAKINLGIRRKKVSKIGKRLDSKSIKKKPEIGRRVFDKMPEPIPRHRPDLPGHHRQHSPDTIGIPRQRPGRHRTTSAHLGPSTKNSTRTRCSTICLLGSDLVSSDTTWSRSTPTRALLGHDRTTTWSRSIFSAVLGKDSDHRRSRVRANEQCPRPSR
ncbi:hypothetical protein LXL04_001000 [Taraxacum kok-saghyz]